MQLQHQHADTDAGTHTHGRTRTHTHTDGRRYTHTHTRTQAHAHKRTHGRRHTHGRTRTHTHTQTNREKRLVVTLNISQGWFKHTEVLAEACYWTFPQLIARLKINGIDRSIKRCVFVITCPNSGIIWGKLSQQNLKLNSLLTLYLNSKTKTANASQYQNIENITNNFMKWLKYSLHANNQSSHKNTSVLVLHLHLISFWLFWLQTYSNLCSWTSDFGHSDRKLDGHK